MSREAHIPLALWMCAAILGHLAGGSGGVERAKVYEDRANVRAFVRGIRSGLRPSDRIFELLTEDVVPTPSTQPSEAPDKTGEPSDEKAEAEPDKTKPAEA